MNPQPPPPMPSPAQATQCTHCLQMNEAYLTLSAYTRQLAARLAISDEINANQEAASVARQATLVRLLEVSRQPKAGQLHAAARQAADAVQRQRLATAAAAPHAPSPPPLEPRTAVRAIESEPLAQPGPARVVPSQRRVRMTKQSSKGAVLPTAPLKN